MMLSNNNAEHTKRPVNIVITGASKGMGMAMVEKFAAGGNNIILCSRNQEQLKATTDRIQNEYPNSRLFDYAADLSVEEQLDNFSAQVLKQFNQVDILINNAGQFIPGSIYNEAAGVLEQMLAVNLLSAYHLTRKFLPSMMALKSGHIINICSIASMKAYANGGSYSISKFALMGFSKNLREELKPYNIKVTSVYPGAVYTASWEGSGVDPNRIMEVDDIADMILASTKLSPQACVEDIIIRPILGDL